MTRDFTVTLGDRSAEIDFRGPEEHPAWQVSLVDTGPVSYTHLDVYKRQV